MLLNSTRLHYQTAFEVELLDEATRSAIVRLVRGWLTRKLGQSSEWNGRWFYLGGSASIGGAIIQTASEVGEGSEMEPEFWSCQLTETDKEHWFRKWHTAIGLRVLEPSKVRFIITVSHSIASEYIGPEPPIPAPSSPRLIRELLASPTFRVSTAGRYLSDKPQFLDTWDVIRLGDFIFDVTRQLPVVIVTKGFGYNQPELRFSRLASDLAGTAFLYFVESDEALAALMTAMPPNYKVFDSRLRIFPVGVSVENDPQGRRSRFFDNEDIAFRGPAAVRDIIIQGVARRPLSLLKEDIVSIRDIEDKTRYRRLVELRKRQDSTNWDELVTLYENEIQTLQDRVAEIEEQKVFYEAEAIANETNLNDSADRLRQLEFERERLTSQVEKLEAQRKSSEERNAAIAGLSTLPRTIIEILQLALSIHPSKVAATKEALVSAEDASCTDIINAWDCIFSVPTTLYNLCFEGNLSPATIETEYRNRTGYELTWTEKKVTKQDPKLMSSRLQVFEGRQINITPHIKLNGSSDAKRLRIHFCVDKSTNRIVIGHCGDHLETAGTRRL